MNKLLMFILAILFICCNSHQKTNDTQPKEDDEEKIASLTRELNHRTLLHKCRFVNSQFRFEDGLCYQIVIDEVCLDSVPDEINKFENPLWLELNDCNLKTIKGLHNSHLLGLSLNGNKFTSLYPLLVLLPKGLGDLSLEFNSLNGPFIIDSFPVFLGVIDLSHNRISSLIFKHPELCGSIRRIKLNSTGIGEIDSSLYLLPNLTYLSINNTFVRNLNIRKFRSLNLLCVDKDFHFNESDLEYIKEKNIYIDRE